MGHSPKSVRHLLQDKPTLQRLASEIRRQERLLADIRRCLPADLGRHCLSTLVRDDVLVVHVSSPAWATRLRYLAPQLVEVLRPEYPGLRSVQARLLVNRTGKTGPTRPSALHSPQAAAIIHGSAEHTSDPALQDALRRLGRAVRTRRP
jgi:hypothetical protein